MIYKKSSNLREAYELDNPDSKCYEVQEMKVQISINCGNLKDNFKFQVTVRILNKSLKFKDIFNMTIKFNNESTISMEGSEVSCKKKDLGDFF